MVTNSLNCKNKIQIICIKDLSDDAKRGVVYLDRPVQGWKSTPLVPKTQQEYPVSQKWLKARLSKNAKLSSYFMSLVFQVHGGEILKLGYFSDPTLALAVKDCIHEALSALP